MTNFDIGFLVSALVAFAAYRVRALDRGGALAALAVGTATYGGLGPAGAVVLLAFFVTSVGLSRVGKARKRALIDVGKQGARDAMQVLANGGVAALCALAALWFDPSYAAAFAGAFAAATADTWGTEIGTLAKGRPRSIFGFGPVATGLSGGVTVAGTLAEAGGAAFIAAVAAWQGVASPLVVGVAGMCGALVDSLLGASLQELRWCAQCERSCETDPHACGANASVVRGIPGLNNDVVNFAATATGALVAELLIRAPLPR